MRTTIRLAALAALLSSCNPQVAGLTCSQESECAAGFWCDQGVCVACESGGLDCDGPPDATLAAGEDAAAAGVDASTQDASHRHDAGGPRDASAAADAATELDASLDASAASDGGGQGQDTGLAVDSGTGAPLDAGALDAGKGWDGGLLLVDGGVVNVCPVDSIQPCWTGPNPSRNVGACHDGTRECVDGVFGPCLNQILPTSEICNGLDDDCNGATDEGLPVVSCGVGQCERSVSCVAGAMPSCVPGRPSAETCNNLDDDCDGMVDGPACGNWCVHVIAGATGGDGSPQLPYGSIAQGISAAVSSRGSRVCVGAKSCDATAQTIYDGPVEMVNGIAVLGGFDATSWTWKPATCITRIQAASSAYAVRFDASVTHSTLLAGFTVQGSSQPTNAAILIEGSLGAVVSDDVILGGGGSDSVGVLVRDLNGTAATPILRHNSIVGGVGSASSTGIKSVNSSPTLLEHCDLFNDTTGRCVSACGDGAEHGIVGRGSDPSSATIANSWGIHLVGSSQALVARNLVCSGDQASAMGVHIDGGGAGVVLAYNAIEAANASFTGASAMVAGVHATNCAPGASPLVYSNSTITAQTIAPFATSFAVRATACDLRIDSNDYLVGSGVGQVAEAAAVSCKQASGCVVTRNVYLVGTLGTATSAYGVDCDQSCTRIDHNQSVTASPGPTVGSQGIGLRLRKSSAFVNANGLSQGCAAQGAGLWCEDCGARVQNNLIQGASCATTGVSEGVHVQASTAELDLHSNTIQGGGVGSSTKGCSSTTLAFVSDPASPAVRPMTVARNNILMLGPCATTLGVADAPPGIRVFQNNDLWAPSTPNLYRVISGKVLVTLDAVNLLPAAKANQSADPKWVSAPGNLRLLSGSPCRNKGTSAGAPKADYDDEPRPNEGAPDIGAFEFY